MFITSNNSFMKLFEVNPCADVSDTINLIFRYVMSFLRFSNIQKANIGISNPSLG